MWNFVSCLVLTALSVPVSALGADWIDPRLGPEVGAGFFAFSMLIFIFAAGVCASAAITGKYPWEHP